MTRSITKPECDRFEAEFAPWLGATIVNKDNLESEVIALFLDIAGIQDRNDFLASTATTLGTELSSMFTRIADKLKGTTVPA